LTSKTQKQAQAAQLDIANQQRQTSQQMADLATKAYAQREQALAKPLSFYSQMATGSPTQMMAAAAPMLSQISKQAQGARGAIMEQRPGAAQQYALGQLARGQGAQAAEALNQGYLGSMEALHGMGQEAGAFGLQGTGAEYSGQQGASQTYGNVAQQEIQKRAAMMSALSGLAGMAGGGLMSAFLPKGGAGGGVGGGYSPTQFMSSALPLIQMGSPSGIRMPGSVMPTYSDAIRLPSNIG
jgi:hypothetical protein